MNMFEKASKVALRFNAGVGLISTEDLWQLTLKELDTLAKSLNKRLKETSEESFISTTTKDTRLELSFEIVKHVIEVKLAEVETAKTRAANKERKEVLLRALANKENAELNDMSSDEIIAELAKID